MLNNDAHLTDIVRRVARERSCVRAVKTDEEDIVVEILETTVRSFRFLLRQNVLLRHASLPQDRYRGAVVTHTYAISLLTVFLA